MMLVAARGTEASREPEPAAGVELLSGSPHCGQGAGELPTSLRNHA